MSEPPRIAHLGPDADGIGGMAAVIRDLLASPLGARYPMTTITTWRSSGPRHRALIFFLGLRRLVRFSLGPGRRIVHVHSATRGSVYRKSACVFVAKLLRRPVILHVHSGAPDIARFDEGTSRLWRGVFRAAFAAADRVLSVSAAGAHELSERYGRAEIAVVPNAAPRVAEADAAPRRAPAGGGARVLYLGGFADRAKGGAVLLEALPELAAAAPAARVTLAGPGELPEDSNGVPDGFAGWAGWLDADAKAGAFRASDVVVFPSLSEGLPVALLEAMAYGRAIVATRVGGMPEVVGDDAEAVLVPAGDPAALAGAIAGLAADPDRRARLGAAARRRAERLNDVEVTDRLDAIYRELAG